MAWAPQVSSDWSPHWFGQLRWVLVVMGSDDSTLSRPGSGAPPATTTFFCCCPSTVLTSLHPPFSCLAYQLLSGRPGSVTTSNLLNRPNSGEQCRGSPKEDPPIKCPVWVPNPRLHNFLKGSKTIKLAQSLRITSKYTLDVSFIDSPSRESNPLNQRNDLHACWQLLQIPNPKKGRQRRKHAKTSYAASIMYT